MPDDRPTDLKDLASLFKLLTFPAANPAPSAPKPTPIFEPMPSFPRQTLPPSVRAFIESSAASARARHELIAAPFLALAGAVIGNQASIDVGQGWIERPVLWISLVAPTGGGKSPALAAARVPFDRLQERLCDKSRSDERHLPGQLRDTGVFSRTGQLHVDPENPMTMRSTPLITTDATMEAIVETLRTSPGLAVVRDELVGIVRAMNQHRNHRGDDRQKYLSLWNHQPLMPINHNKVNQTIIRTPVVCIVGGIQHRVVAKLRSRDEDGFIERFLPVVCNPLVYYWNETANARHPLPDLEGIVDLLQTLHTLRDRHPDGLRVVRDPDAGAVWAHWYNENVDRMHAAPISIRGFYQKLPAHVARLALILHLLWHSDHPDQPLSAQTMTYAVTLGEFFRVHIHRQARILGEHAPIPDAKPTLEDRIARILAEADTPGGWLTRTEIYNRSGRPSRTDLTAALKSLHDRSAITIRITTSPNAKRRTTEYRAL